MKSFAFRKTPMVKKSLNKKIKSYKLNEVLLRARLH